MKRNLKRLISAGLAAVMTLTGTSFTGAAVTGEDGMLPYQNESLSFEERAADLVSRMTLEEKVAQLGHSDSDISRLGISKYYYWREALHGVARQGKATSFPSSLSMSNTWDTDLMAQVADVISTEARGMAAKNGTSDLSYWSPTVNMARDPRWGRNDETYGEDPYLTSEIGSEFVKGMQGDDDTYLKTISTIKHFIANNCEGERQGGSSVMDEQTLRDYYGRAFEDIVKDAAPASVMSSYNATSITRNGETLYDYIPSTANEYLLTELLRSKWGFLGYVVGDCGSVNNLNSRATYKRTLFPDAEVLSEVPQSATAALAIQAGNDLDCGSVSQATLYEAVEEGYLSEEELDFAVYRLFLQRFRTGEFDSNVSYKSISSSVLETAEHVALAETAAEESWVLLKNEDDILPFADTVKNVAIVGDLADTTYLGDYSGEPTDTTSPYEGLQQVLAETHPGAEVHWLGNVDDSTVIFNLKSLTLVKTDGTAVSIDLSKATDTSGLTVSGSSLINVTSWGTAVIKNVDFSDVASVKAEISTGYDSPGGSLLLGYGSSTLQVASLDTQTTASLDDYAEVTAAYTGTDGGYNSTADLYLSVSASSEFSVDAYKTQLDEADVIIAYGTTTTSDAKESNDRSSIAMPSHEAHVAEISAAYPDKTVVVLQTVGQMDVSTFEDNCKAIIWSCYNGQKQGLALAKILAGQVNPSGRLSTTWYDPADLLKMPINTTKKTTDSEGITWSRNENYKIRQETDYPGRTYQYYNGTPVYSFGYGLTYTDFEYSNLNISDTSVDANGSITASVTVKNTGDREGSEVVQLYITSPGGDGVNLPLKQLKGFKRVTLGAGESAVVSITVDIPDLHFYSEATQTEYVPAGGYTLMVGRNADDSAMLSKTFTVTGSLDSKLSVVSAVPSGIRVVGAVNDDGTLDVTLTSVEANVTAYMSDEAAVELSPSNTTYTSSDERVAVVDENGLITAGTEDGTAIITASVTADGVAVSTDIPIVCQTKAAVTEEMINDALTRLKTAYESYTSSDYSDTNWALITTAYEEAVSSVKVEKDSDILEETTTSAIEYMASIRVKPASGTSIYTIDKTNDTVYGTIETEISYHGDDMEPTAVLIAAVYDENGVLERLDQKEIGDSGDYILDGPYTNKDKMELYIWDGIDTMKPLSEKLDHTFTIADDTSIIVYNFTDSDYDDYFDSTDDVALPTVNGLNGYGGFNTKSAKYSYTVAGTTYNFTRGLQAGLGSTTRRCLYFTPISNASYTKCTVTVLFNSPSADRYQGIYQGGAELAKSTTYDTSGLNEVTAEITDFTQPVYTYGGGSNKYVFAIIAAYE
ncbi:MAG: glycoside hydrolase family 3 C-terminal domain-containing protein [Clostridiales bacterium]|nr:glycoside hydrolase family 3 C-terminal domain-containing protein [Clostridiales bacterium]